MCLQGVSGDRDGSGEMERIYVYKCRVFYLVMFPLLEKIYSTKQREIDHFVVL